MFLYYLKLYLDIFLSMVQLVTMFEIISFYLFYALLSYQQLICNKQILIYLIFRKKCFSLNDDLKLYWGCLKCFPALTWMQSFITPNSNAVKFSGPIVKNDSEKQHCCEDRTCFRAVRRAHEWGIRLLDSRQWLWEHVHDGTTMAASFGACPLRWLFHLWCDSCRMDDTHSGNTN